MKELIEKLDLFSNQASFETQLLFKGDTKVVSFLNAHAVNLCNGNIDFHWSLINSDFLLRDGIGVKIACKYFDYDPACNMNGTDLIPLLIKKYESLSFKVYFLGSTPDVSNSLSGQYLTSKKHFFIDGFRSDEEYLGFIDNSEPALVILGMGMPKQELLSLKIKASKDQNLLIVNGGAIIDRLSGIQKRGPRFLYDNGLEWLYRLYSSPRRMFGRYVIGIPKFFYLMLRESIK